MKKRINSISKLSELLNDSVNSNIVEIIKLASLWKEVVGSDISCNSVPLKINKNILTLGVFDNIWMQELSFLKGDIINRLKTRDIFIKEIRFILCVRKKTISKVTKHKSLRSADKSTIEYISNNIKDPSLKENYKRALSAYLISRDD